MGQAQNSYRVTFGPGPKNLIIGARIKILWARLKNIIMREAGAYPTHEFKPYKNVSTAFFCQFSEHSPEKSNKAYSTWYITLAGNTIPVRNVILTSNGYDIPGRSGNSQVLDSRFVMHQIMDAYFLDFHFLTLNFLCTKLGTPIFLTSIPLTPIFLRTKIVTFHY